ncbi:MAG: hypothetical protein OFPI_03920 [Osedax symbiont Rs2]|nr:MAG: hypothetical protein OFPI_03920 [Osedax symbiont Rs2]
MKTVSILALLTLVFLAQSLSAAGALTLTSPVMKAAGTLPLQYTCDGEGLSPPIRWHNVPENTASFVIIMHHNAGVWDRHFYWTMYNIPAKVNSIDSGQSAGERGANSVNKNNQSAPPCSKGPGLKSYTISLYALSAELNLSTTRTVTESVLIKAMKGLLIESAELEVSFERLGVATGPKKIRKRKRGDNKRPANGSRPPRGGLKLDVPSEALSVKSSACRAIQSSVSAAGFSDVRVTCDSEYAYLVSDTYPAHDLMNGITGTNEQIPVPARNYAAPIKLRGKMATVKTSMDAALGIAVNGVPIYDYSSAGEIDIQSYDPGKDTVTTGQLDNCGGHAGRGDDYHYHAKPSCMLEVMENAADSAVLGWGYDGFPLYGDNNPDGSAIKSADLDVCNGQSDEVFGYRYHTSNEPPYIMQCLVGVVDTKILPRVSPLQGAKTRSDLRPPREGVTKLIHRQSADGTRSMSYQYRGTKYYSNYKPAANRENCFDFVQKTISGGGVLEKGTFCRND